MNVKRSLLVGATLTTLVAGAGGVGVVSAATSSSTTSSGTSLVDKIAAKFNLSKSDVQAVFDADHQEHAAQMEADQKSKLATAVSDGKLTQAQSDHITQVMSEIKTLRGTTSPQDESDTVRSQIKSKLDDLRTWATTNNVDTQYIMMGHGGRGPGKATSSTSSSSSSTDSSSSSTSN
jgi:predicted NBD/HSP70 family sugar kinase